MTDKPKRSVKKNIRWIFWGVFIVTFDLEFDGFDLFIDPLGLLLLAVGCARLRGSSTSFRRSAQLSFVFAAIGWIGLFGFDQSAPGWVLGSTVRDLLLIWLLMTGLSELTFAIQRFDYSRRALGLRNAFAITTAVMVAVGVWLPITNDVAQLQLVVGIAALVLTAMILIHIWRISRIPTFAASLQN